MKDVTVTIAYGYGVDAPTTEAELERANQDAREAFVSRRGYQPANWPEPTRVTERGLPALRWTFADEEPA